MKTAALSELKARLSEYLNRAKAGEEIPITDRGKPVARLLPISRKRAVRESMTAMEKRGLIRLGSGKFAKDFWTMPKAKDSEGLVLRALLWTEGATSEAEFVCLDQNLREAALKEGFTILPLIPSQFSSEGLLPSTNFRTYYSFNLMADGEIA